MNVHARLRWLLLVGVLLAPVLSACGGGAASAPIKVGSKDFTEEFIVAELYAQVLEHAGFAVERKFNLGGTPVAQAAITRGDIDLYPEYTSTGLLTILKQDRIADSAQILPAVKAEYEQKFQLTWLNPSPFNDTNGLATTKAIADTYDIRTISDLAARASELRVGGPAEFAEREDGIKGLRKTYGGFQFKEFKQFGTGPLRYDALKHGEIDIALVFTTEARIAADQLVVLHDDKRFYPIYNIAPVVRMDTLQKNPKIAEALNRLAPLVTDAVIASLNAQVDIDKQEFATVAKAFLNSRGLLKK